MTAFADISGELDRQAIELPSWAFGNSGTRFKVFSQAGVPRDPYEKLADAVNHLLVVGFYLVNLGFVALYLSGDETIADTRGIFEALSTKLGVVLLVLGVMHLGNVYVLNRIRRRGVMEREQVPPVPPQGWAAPQAGA